MRIVFLVTVVFGVVAQFGAAEARSAVTPATRKVVRGGGVGPQMSQNESVAASLLLALNSGYLNGCALSGAVTASTKAPATADTGMCQAIERRYLAGRDFKC